MLVYLRINVIVYVYVCLRVCVPVRACLYVRTYDVWGVGWSIAHEIKHEQNLPSQVYSTSRKEKKVNKLKISADSGLNCTVNCIATKMYFMM